MFLLSHKGKELLKVGELSGEEEDLIKRNSVIGSDSFVKKQEILREIHSKGLWIQCGCNSQNPIVGVRHREEYYHLFNMNKRGVHDSKCPLHRLPSDLKGGKEEVKTAEKKKNSFVFHYDKRETKPSEKNKIGSTKKTLSENSLWVCLRRILSLSEIDKIGGQLDIGYNLRKRAALKTIRDLRLGGVSMAKVSRWGIEKHEELCEIVGGLTEDGGMPKGAAHGIMFSVIESLNTDDRKNIVLRNGNSRVVLPRTADIEINGKQGLELASPYFVIYTVVNTSEADEEVICEPQKVFITPIHSLDTLMPISSELDRTVIDKAISNVKYNQGKGNNIEFIKPLYPLISPISERFVLPSLIARSNESQIFIDINEHINSENKERLARRREAMNEITDIISIDGWDSEKEFEKKAFEGVSRAAKYLLGIERNAV